MNDCSGQDPEGCQNHPFQAQSTMKKIIHKVHEELLEATGTKLLEVLSEIEYDVHARRAALSSEERAFRARLRKRRK